MTVTEEKGTDSPKYDPLKIYELPISQIFADEEFNCRGLIDATSVIELANDIRDKGLDQPITVRPYHDPLGKKKFQVVAGFRRFKAHLVIEAPTIKAMVRDLDDITARVHNLRENLQRQELNIKQEAHAIEHLRFLGRDTIAKKVGKSPGWIQQRLYLLELPDAIQNEAAAGYINVNAIRECAMLHTEQEQYDFVKKIKERKLAKTEDKVKPSPKGRPKGEIRSKVEMYKMQELLVQYCGTCMGAKVLAWALGELDIEELYAYMEEEFGPDFKRPE